MNGPGHGRPAREKLDGTVVAERFAPKDSFAGAQMNTPWDPPQRACFNGEALPTKRRAYVEGPEHEPVKDLPTIWIDLSEIAFT